MRSILRNRITIRMLVVEAVAGEPRLHGDCVRHHYKVDFALFKKRASVS